MSDDFKKQIIGEFKTVIDPELGVNVVDLGLIYDMSFDKDQKILSVDMTLTTPGCPLHDFFRESMESAALNIDEIDDIEINFVFEPPWDMSKISDDARTQLGIAS